ncbi:MAG TPA: Eco57I restriction-modification methylase domain-containing protein [Pyrinomonadaceae bacterium]
MSSVTLASYIPKIQPEKIEKVFDIENITKEFLQRYKDHYDNVRDELNQIFKKNTAVREDFKRKGIEIDDFAKKLLGQIVFLYFLQKKGWFGVKRGSDWGTGDKNYLRHLFQERETYYRPGDKCNFFNNILEPLFYNTLAVERTDDWADQFGCKIPFLNGGLFEPLFGYDWVNTELLLPDRLFSNSEPTKEGDVGTGILDVFDRYNFTVNEAEPLEKQVAVDPEMLGKVFENLLPENLRHTGGIYYTPRPIVSYMCQQCLINYLATHAPDVPRAEIEAFIGISGLPDVISRNAQKLDKLLEAITVCDPAIGSGAFPVGMMQEIVRARKILATVADVPKRSTYELKRHVIENSLCGVDIDPGAVEIAKLRLWLSLVVDEDHRHTIPSLPNLDHKIMQGNSLLKSNSGFDIVIANPPYIDSERMTNEMPELRQAILDTYTLTRGNWDIYIAFFEKGFNLLNPKGTLAFISPDKWISKPFGDELRKRKTANILSIMGAGRDVFDTVNVDAIVTVFGPVTADLEVFEWEDGRVRPKITINKDQLKEPYTYDWLFSDHIELLAGIGAHRMRLSNVALCENACATSDAYKLKPFIVDKPGMPGYLRIINTGTIGKYESKWGLRDMVYLGDRYTCPVVNRRDFLTAFPNTYGKKSVKPKIIIKGLNLLDACLDEDGTIIPGKTTLIVTSDSTDDLKLLLAFINSRIAQFYLEERYPASSYNQGITFTKEMLNNLPLPSLSLSERNKLISIVNRILAAKRTDPHADTSSLEADIDHLVYQLYGLTEDEIAKITG